MKKSEILKSIRKFCASCPLRCDDSCRLYCVKNGIDPTPRKSRVPTEKQLEALKRSHRRQGTTDLEYDMGGM